MNEYELEVYALLMNEGKVDEANAYRAKCEQADFDALDPHGPYEDPNAWNEADVAMLFKDASVKEYAT